MCFRNDNSTRRGDSNRFESGNYFTKLTTIIYYGFNVGLRYVFPRQSGFVIKIKKKKNVFICSILIENCREKYHQTTLSLKTLKCYRLCVSGAVLIGTGESDL